jgi:hypothetical protein
MSENTVEPSPGQLETGDQEFCPKREDRQHCNCWYDGEVCCGCGAPVMTEAEKREQGLEE